MYHPYPPDQHNAQAGPSRPASSPKPKKRRRLQFTSDLRPSTIQRYNPDGSETVEYLHAQSTARLKRKWDSIFERFKDAHLHEQDEIYLGNRAHGEPIVVVKDRGSLRSLRQNMTFGVFIKDEELQGWKDRPEAREMDDVDELEDEFDPMHAPIHPQQRVGQVLGEPSSEEEDEEDDPAANDPDLREFLQAEARRKAMLSRDDDEEEDDDVIDFADPMWNSSHHHISPFHPNPPTAPPSHRQPPTRPPLVPELASSSEDNSDTDVVTVHSDSDEELVDAIRTKRQNVEELLQCTTPFETLPYNDIFGLADLLRLDDSTSRLYVDLVSDSSPSDDDDDEGDNGDNSVQVVQQADVERGAEREQSVVEERATEQVVGTVYASSLVGNPASSQPISDRTTSQPSQTSLVPLSLPVPSPTPTIDRSARIKLEQHTPDRAHLRARSVSSTRTPPPPTAAPAEVQSPAPRATPPTPAEAEAEAETEAVVVSTTQRATDNPATPRRPPTPSTSTPATALLRSNPSHKKTPHHTPTSTAARRTPNPARQRTPKPARRPRAPSFSDEPDTDTVAAQCGGPTKCTKTFCLHCASLSRT